MSIRIYNENAQNIGIRAQQAQQVGVGANMGKHIADTNNPHRVTAEQIGAVPIEGIENYLDYNNFTNKPKINGVELVGDVSTQDLGLTSNQIMVDDKDNYYEGETIEDVFAEIGEKMKDGLGKIDDVVNEQGTSLVEEKVAKITPQNIGAVAQTEKGDVNGVATLDERAKVLISQLPDFVLGQVLFGGTVINSNGVLTATLTNNAKHRLNTLKNEITLSNDNTTTTGYASNEGIYYIAKNEFSFAGKEFEIGDWVISDGSAWQKIDNTDSAGIDNIEVDGLTIIFTYTDGSKKEFELPYEQAELAEEIEVGGDKIEMLEGATLNLASLPPEIGVIADDGIHYLVPEVELELTDGRLVYMQSRNAIPITAGEGIEFKKNDNNTVSINAKGANYGAENAGKFLVVGEDGSIVTESMIIGESMMI